MFLFCFLCCQFLWIVHFFIAPTVFYEMATCNLKMLLADRTQNSASYNEYLSSPQFVLVVSVLLIALAFDIVLLCVIIFLVPCWCPLRFPHRKLCLVRLSLQLFVGGLISYLQYLCLFVYIGVQSILSYVCVCLSASCVHYVAISLDCPFLVAPVVFTNV